MEKNIIQRKNSVVTSYCQKQNKKVKPERSSTSGYLIDILALQKKHLPKRNNHEKTGML